MGTNGQAMLDASSSAEEAGEGGGVPGGFPFVVLSGGEATEGESVNAAFAAYARRSVPPGRTAREALAFALAEAAAAEAGAGGDAARVDEASYGVTRSPFASTSAPVPTPKAEAKPENVSPAPAPVQETAKKEGAARRRPALRASDVSAPPISAAPSAHASPSVSAPAPVPAAEQFPPASAPSSPAAEVAATPASAPGKLKVSIRRDAPPGGTAPAVSSSVPPPDAPFFFGPVMDGSRAPLVPLPVASGAPDGAFVPPAHVATRSPFPSAGAAPSPITGGAALAPLGGQPASVPAGQGRVAARMASERRSERRRVAVVGVLLVALGLVVYLGYRSPYWPFPLKHAAVAEAKPSGEVEGSGAEAPPEAISPRAAHPASLSVQSVEHPTRPAPSAGFVGMLEGLRITGVLQGEPVRAIIDGRLVQSGDLVDVAREIRLVGLDVPGRQLIFEDRTTARASVRY